MMDDMWGTILISISSALLGGGGLAALLRARVQNQVDLLQLQINRVAALEQQLVELDRRNDDLIARNAELMGQIASLRTENEMLSKRLEVQRVLIDDLQQKVARLSIIEDENAQLRQQLQIERAKRELCEREVITLREQISTLRMPS